MPTGFLTRLRPRSLERDAALGRVWERVAAVPAWVWLLSLVGLSFGIRLGLSRAFPAPWIFPDEVTYAELARSFADSGSFEVRETPVPGFSRVYPALLAPAFALFDDQAHAYAAAKAINALLMSLVAVPVYLLARRLVRPGLALLAAALSLAIPSMFYSSLIMTEAAFYPVFALFALALVVMLERPTVFRQLAVVALLVVAYYTRTQAISLVPAALTATALIAFTESRHEASGFRLRAFWRSLLTFRVLWVVVVGAVVLRGAVQLARGLPLQEVFGAYESVATADYSVGSVARWFLYDVVNLDLAFGVVPLAALFLVVASASRRGALRNERAFAAGAAAVVVWFVLVVAMFQSSLSPRLEERLIFHLVPLLFVALVVWIDGWRPVDWRLRAAVALVVCALPLAFPLGEMLEWTMVSDSFGLWPLNHLLENGFGVAGIALAVAFGVLACGLAFVFLRGWWRLAVPALLLVVLALGSSHVDERMRFYSTSALQAGIGLRRDWVDEAVGSGGRAVSLWAQTGVQADWQNEFFNESLGRSYHVTFVGDGLPSDNVVVDPGGILRDTAGKAVQAEYAVADRTYRLQGEPVVVDPVIGTTVYRVDGPLRLEEYVGGLFPDRYSGAELEYIRWDCPGGELNVAFTQNALLIDRPQTVTATVDGREVARAVVQPTAIDQPLTVPLTPDSNGACTVGFAVTPIAVPDDVLGNGDERRLGVQFTRLDFVPPG